MNTRSAITRYLVRLLRSPRSREQLARACAVLVILGPILVLAFDHHGAERLPNHVHLTTTGQSVPAHVHGFEVPHIDGVDSAPINGEVAIVAAAPTAVLVLMFVQTLGLPSARPPILASSTTGNAQLAHRQARNQTSIHPPTPPPTA